jgi:hypothetical protein
VFSRMTRCGPISSTSLETIGYGRNIFDGSMGDTLAMFMGDGYVATSLPNVCFQACGWFFISPASSMRGETGMIRA